MWCSNSRVCVCVCVSIYIYIYRKCHFLQTKHLQIIKTHVNSSTERTEKTAILLSLLSPPWTLEIEKTESAHTLCQATDRTPWVITKFACLVFVAWKLEKLQKLFMFEWYWQHFEREKEWMVEVIYTE